MSVVIYYMYSFDVMAFEHDLDPAQSWQEYLRDLRTEAESSEDVFIFSNWALRESMDELKRRVVFELQEGPYDSGPGGSRLWRIKLTSDDSSGENELRIHRHAVMAPLYDWLQRVIPTNRYGNDWVGTAILLTESSESYTCGFSLNREGVIFHRTTYGMGTGETWEPGFWRGQKTGRAE